MISKPRGKGKKNEIIKDRFLNSKRCPENIKDDSYKSVIEKAFTIMKRQTSQTKRL